MRVFYQSRFYTTLMKETVITVLFLTLVGRAGALRSPSQGTVTRGNPRLMSSKDEHVPMISVAMTREEGKNTKLFKAMRDDESLSQLIDPVELPCIAHADGPDLTRLRDSLLEPWDYVAITSPEAARVLAKAWDSSTMSSIKVAAVGKATEKELKSNNIDVMFTPSKAYAKTLVEELPGSTGTRLLYPASCRAPGTLADGLTERGFNVVRLNTYDTVTAEWTDAQKEYARQCQIACFASPSSIKGWLKNSGDNKHVFAACIGQTSANACIELGWDESNIFHPESPGIDGWVDAIKQAVHKLNSVTSPV